MVCDDTSHIAKPHSPRDRYVGFYDVDNLDTISKEKIREHIEQCTSMLILINDETPQSEWCIFESRRAAERKRSTKVEPWRMVIVFSILPY